MTAKEALRSLDAFFLNAAFQCGDLMDTDGFDEPFDEPVDDPDESVRDADKEGPKPKKELIPHGEDYDHLVKIFCGDTTLATYWWRKDHE